MKKILYFLICFSFLGFSFSSELTSDYDKIPTTLFYDMYNYSQDNVDKSFNLAYKSVAKSLGITSYAVKKILDGDEFYCFKVFQALGIIKPNANAPYETIHFSACRNKVLARVDNYVTSNLIKLGVDDALKGENFLADGDEENSNYDLLIDFKHLTEILFKEEIKLVTKFDLLAKRESLSSGGGSSGKGKKNNTGKANAGTNELPDFSNILDNDSTSIVAPDNVDNNLDKNVTRNLGNTNISKIPNKNILGNIPIGPKCSTGSNLGNSLNNNLENSGKLSGNDSLISDYGDNSNDYFGDNWNVGKFIDKDASSVDLDTLSNRSKLLNISGTNITGNNTTGNNSSGGGGSGACPSDNLLSICINFIPAGPRGPVGGTTKKRSIEEVIDKISDTLKDMRYSWIIPAGHGDEALDIDFKHVKLDEIFAFNIILSPKPVFNFKKDKKTAKQANAADTELENVPRKLAKIYADVGIVDGFNYSADLDKYLITNFDKVKPSRRVKFNYPEKVIDDDSKGIFDEAEKYDSLLENILNMLNSMDDLSENWVGSAMALYGKSEN